LAVLLTYWQYYINLLAVLLTNLLAVLY